MKIAKFGLSLFGINTYIVWDTDTKECAVIDPGMISKQEEEAMTAFIEREHLVPTHLINTHLHIDHAIGNRFVEKKYGLTAEAHPADAPLGERIAAQAEQFGLPFDVESVTIGRQLNDGDIIRIGNGLLHVIHVPGHSPGGIALYDKEDGFLISGDALFQGSIGRTDLPGGSHSTLLSSIKDKLLTLPEDTTVFPGHGPATTIGDEIRHNPFF